MPAVETAPTATAAQTRATGSRMIGYYMDGPVRVDCLFDTANFLTKDAAGNFLADGASGFSAQFRNTADANRGGQIKVTGGGGAGAVDLGTTSSGYALTFSIDATECARLAINGCFGFGTTNPLYRLHARSSSEIARYETTTARTGGNGYIGIADPSGRKGYWGYGDSVDDMFMMNEMPRSLIFGTSGVIRWVISNNGMLFPIADNGYDIGVGGSNRVRDLFLVNSPTVTSDERDKTWRGAPTEAELRAARRIAAELGFYQWKDAIAAKGADGARMHFGVRAQAVWAIMADEGLIEPLAEGVDPGSAYAFLCWDKWDAMEPVEAVDEVRDEGGNIVTEARPAQPGREAGNRFGIRVDQLVLFLIAAQEARLSAVEAAGF